MENMNKDIDRSEYTKNLENYLERTTKENLKIGDNEVRLDVHLVLAAFLKFNAQNQDPNDKGGFRKGTG